MTPIVWGAPGASPDRVPLSAAFASKCFVILISGLLIAAGGQESDLAQTDTALDSLKDLADELNNTIQTETTAVRQRDHAGAARGARLYRVYCVGCRLDGGEGAPNWHQKDAAGNYPAPPLNGTAHTWHHPLTHLLEIIQDGSQVIPAFGDRLSDAEIIDIIHWFQSLWPDDVYASWVLTNNSYNEPTN